MSEEKDASSVAIDPVIDSLIAKSGSISRVYYTLERSPKGLTIQDVAKLTGLSETTCYIRVRQLFNAQKVQEIRRDNVRLYRLRPLDQGDIAVLNDSKKRSLQEM